MTTRWQSWHAAFEEAGKTEHSLSAPHGRLILPLTGSDFAAALGDLLTTRVLLMTPEQHQEACRTGSLTWFDARGRCVVIHRESGLARAPVGSPPPPRTAADVDPTGELRAKGLVREDEHRRPTSLEEARALDFGVELRPEDEGGVPGGLPPAAPKPKGKKK